GRIHSVHRVRIAGLAHFDDPAVTDSDVALHDSPMVDDEGVGDDQVQRALGPSGPSALTHAVANDFAAAKSDLVAIAGEVLFDFDDQVSIGQAHTVARGGSVEIGVDAPRNREAHWFPLPWCP